jgi:hypothetical protein
MHIVEKNPHISILFSNKPNYPSKKSNYILKKANLTLAFLKVILLESRHAISFEQLL